MTRPSLVGRQREQPYRQGQCQCGQDPPCTQPQRADQPLHARKLYRFGQPHVGVTPAIRNSSMRSAPTATMDATQNRDTGRSPTTSHAPGAHAMMLPEPSYHREILRSAPLSPSCCIPHLSRLSNSTAGLERRPKLTRENEEQIVD